MAQLSEQEIFDAQAKGIAANQSGLPQDVKPHVPRFGDRPYKLAWAKEWLRGWRRSNRAEDHTNE